MAQLELFAKTFIDDTTALHNWVQGDENTTVNVAGGPLDSPRKLIKQWDAAANQASDGVLAQAVDAKNAAQQAAVDAQSVLNDALKKADASATTGASLLGYDGGTLQDVADFAKPLQDYSALRNYAGRAKSIRITKVGIAGIFDYDSSDVSSADNGGTIIVDSIGRRWKRWNQGITASPFWFDIPLTSNNVDYTAKLQALITHPFFKFPSGFKASTGTLYPKSNTNGNWSDAIIKLLPGMPNLTPQVSFEDSQSNIYYVGGTFDGNRGMNSGTGASGQDGGMHNLRIYSGSNIRWFGPKLLNAGTDGVYVNQTGGLINDVHIYSPISNNASRQGCSIINVAEVHFYDSSWLNTNGIAPQAGIDIEPNLPTENVRSFFHGITRCEGNAGRGCFIDGKDNNGIYSVFFDDYVARNNGAESFRMTRGGVQNVIARSMDCDGAVSFGPFGTINFNVTKLIAKSLSITTETPSTAYIVLRGDDWDVGGYNYASTSSADCAWDIKGVNAARRDIAVNKLVARNAGTNANNSYSGLIYGSAGLTVNIKDYRSVSPRGLILSGNGNQSEINVIADTALQNTAVNLLADATGFKINLKKKISDGILALQCAGGDNDILVNWNGANAALAVITGANNRISLLGRNGTAVLAGLGSASSGNMIYASFLHRTDAGTLIDKAGTGNVYIGNVPTSLNS